MKRIRIAWTHKTIKKHFDDHGSWYNNEGDNREKMQSVVDKYNSDKKAMFKYFIEEEGQENETKK